MNEIQKGVMILVKSALDEKAYPLPEEFSIDEAFDFIVKHSVATLAYDGAVKCGISASEPAMQKLFRIYIRSMLHSEKQMNAIEEIYSVFDKNGIDYLPLKGCVMKALYPKPELRLMGDADILIKKCQYDKIKELVENLGFQGGEEVTHHFVWASKFLHLELHTMPMPENYKNFYDYYKDGWSRAKKTETHRYRYSDEDCFIFVFTHFAKHYLDGGIGLRHITDLYVLLKKFPEMDFAYIEREFEKTGLLLFFHNTLSVMEHWFENKKANDAAETISDFILQSGNWGEFESHAIANGARNSGGKKIKASKMKYFLRTTFPSVNTIGPRYSWVRKVPFLLPVAWVLRGFDVLLFRNERIPRKIKYLKTIEDEKVDAHRKNLEKAGFRF